MSAGAGSSTTPSSSLVGEASLVARLLFDRERLPPRASKAAPTATQPLAVMHGSSLRAALRGGVPSQTIGPFDRNHGASSACVLRTAATRKEVRSAVVFETADGAPATLRLGSEWTLWCWLQLPLPALPKKQKHDGVRTLACGAAVAGDDGAKPVNLCHVQIVREDDDALRLAVEAEPGKRQVLHDLDLRSLPNGWNSLAAVGAGGQTSFHVNGRAVGTLAAQVTADVLWVGNHPAADGRSCGALGALADVRAYQAALPPETLRALDGAGGSEPSVAGVWGAAGAPPPADVAFDVPYELPRADAAGGAAREDAAARRRGRSRWWPPRRRRSRRRRRRRSSRRSLRRRIAAWRRRRSRRSGRRRRMAAAAARRSGRRSTGRRRRRTPPPPRRRRRRRRRRLRRSPSRRRRGRRRCLSVSQPSRTSRTRTCRCCGRRCSTTATPPSRRRGSTSRSTRRSCRTRHGSGRGRTARRAGRTWTHTTSATSAPRPPASSTRTRRSTRTTPRARPASIRRSNWRPT